MAGRRGQPEPGHLARSGEPGTCSRVHDRPPRHGQRSRTCHGGYLFLLADTAFAFACNTHGAPVVASGADVTFLRPAREGDELVAVAVERALTGRSGLYDVTVLRGDEVVLEFRGRSRVVPSPTTPTA